MTDRKAILFIACSLDGYIAGPNDELDFLSMVEREGQDYGYGEFIGTVDTVIMGRRTYEKVLSFGIPFPHADKETYIITRTARPAEGNVSFYTGGLAELMRQLKGRPGRNIFVDGGSQIANELLRLELLDEMVISIIPVLLGDGILLFTPGRPRSAWQLVSSEGFESGLVQMRYRKETGVGPASSD